MAAVRQRCGEEEAAAFKASLRRILLQLKRARQAQPAESARAATRRALADACELLRPPSLAGLAADFAVFVPVDQRAEWAAVRAEEDARRRGGDGEQRPAKFLRL